MEFKEIYRGYELEVNDFINIYIVKHLGTWEVLINCQPIKSFYKLTQAKDYAKRLAFVIFGG